MEPATKRDDVEHRGPADKSGVSPLQKVIDEVKQDAKRDPEGYARETIVPEGGE